MLRRVQKMKEICHEKMVVKTLIGSDDAFAPTDSSCSSLLWFYHFAPIDQGLDHSLWSDRRLPLLAKWWKAQQKRCGC